MADKTNDTKEEKREAKKKRGDLKLDQDARLWTSQTAQWIKRVTPDKPGNRVQLSRTHMNNLGRLGGCLYFQYEEVRDRESLGKAG